VNNYAKVSPKQSLRTKRFNTFLILDTGEIFDFMTNVAGNCFQLFQYLFMKLRFIVLFGLNQKEPKSSRPGKNLLKIPAKKLLEKNSLRSNSFSRLRFFL
jgi:hypothetical protein